MNELPVKGAAKLLKLLKMKYLVIKCRDAIFTIFEHQKFQRCDTF